MKNLQSILEVTWTPKGVDPVKTSTGARNMPIEMKNVIDSLRRELKDNGIELGTILSAGRDAYNQGRVMYANWFDLPQNQMKQGETDEVLLARRKKYITGLYRGNKSVAVDKIFADAYRIGKDGNGGIKPDVLKTALDNVETYLTANPISNHQGNGAIDVPSNSKLSNFIKSGKSKYAKSCLPESNHLHIALNIGASNTPYVKPAGTKENPIVLDPGDTKSSRVPVSFKQITTDKFVKLRQFFGDKTIKISPANISDIDSKVKKTAVIEYNNSVYSLSQMLNEKFGDGLRQRANILLNGKQNDAGLSNSNTPGAIAPATVNDTDVEPNALEKPAFNLIYDKKSNLIQIEASNGEAAKHIGYGIKHVTDRAEQYELANLMGIENFKTNQEIEAEEAKEKTALSSRSAVSSIESDKTNVSTNTEAETKHSYAGDTATKGAEIAKKLMRDLSLTKEQASGIVGNLWAESGLVPDRIQGSGMKTGTISQASSGGYGWAQYTHQSLKNDFIKHAKSKGIDIKNQPATDDINYSYLVQWIKSNATRLSKLKSKSSTRDATDFFLKQYEKPADQSKLALNKRSGYANAIFSKIA